MEQLSNLKYQLEQDPQDSQRLYEIIGCICDGLEYSDASKEEILSELNILLGFFDAIKTEDSQEELLSGIYRVTEHQVIDTGLELDGIIERINDYSDACKSYIFAFMSFAGKIEYREILKKYLTSDNLREDAEEALVELNDRIIRASTNGNY